MFLVLKSRALSRVLSRVLSRQSLEDAVVERVDVLGGYVKLFGGFKRVKVRVVEHVCQGRDELFGHPQLVVDDALGVRHFGQAVVHVFVDALKVFLPGHVQNARANGQLSEGRHVSSLVKDAQHVVVVVLVGVR